MKFTSKLTVIAGACAALALSGCVYVQASSSDRADEERVQAAPPIIAEAPALDTATGPGDRMPSGRDLGVRSAVVAPNAAAATAHPLATQTALDTMKAGGNAVDAAIAANAMLGLVEPTGNGIGGDLFAIVWDPKTQQLYGYNGSGRSAMGATLEDMQAKADEFMDGEEIPPYGAASVTVPGTVDGWYALHERFGKRLMNENLEPAIRYAREGAPIPEVIAFYWSYGPKRYAPAYESGMLEEYDNAKETYFSPTPVEGSLFRNPDLADTLERIAYKGRDEFYTGETAHIMADYFERIGGYLTYEDFANHEGEWVEPLCVSYRDEVKLCELPPNTQGVAALQMLQMLERFDLRSMGFGSADSLVAQIEAKRLAFADRAKSYADPEFAGIDPSVFIREGYNAERAGLIDIKKPMASVDAGMDFAADAKLEDGDTTYLTVTDSDGMMVSLIQSNYRGMGSGLVADTLGFMFQDRGQLFSLDPDHPNVFEPGKRPFHTIIPAFAFKKDMPGCQVRAVAPELACPYEPWMSFGLMGGGMQPQGHVQIILNLVDFDMGLQEAGDAARWEHRGGCEPTDDYTGDSCESDMGVVHLESGIPEATRAELERRGYTVECCEANGGGYQAIARDFDSGAWIAATEMRKDGNADGY
ncbi:gamma-glutamyltransferase family protein [Henriciella mobilis]|uniref:gamma-glutamyltransferase family protein n=1 Tax=Henriciella mobilis TaxID=2305467 RepID=UPI000E65F71B|nr:gamma-glutamyltransferase family protein [Henriciella mobilis]RIJ17372.1 gamma-glutamyltransferase family protein [Henriciella mobilis]RIJ25639.1 gamma-glutamyltransferase family protein [Henriciella mobilis]